VKHDRLSVKPCVPLLCSLSGVTTWAKHNPIQQFKMLAVAEFPTKKKTKPDAIAKIPVQPQQHVLPEAQEN
jgi:hypothetical protein